MDSKELANHLDVSHDTVKWAIRNIDDRMNFGRHLVRHEFVMVEDGESYFDQIPESLSFAVATRLNALHKYARVYLTSVFDKPAGNTESTSWLSPLFAHMAKEHNLSLTESELGDIMDVCIRIQKYEADGAQ